MRARLTARGQTVLSPRPKVAAFAENAAARPRPFPCFARIRPGHARCAKEAAMQTIAMQRHWPWAASSAIGFMAGFIATLIFHQPGL
jgi:hypothetical protein